MAEALTLNEPVQTANKENTAPPEIKVEPNEVAVSTFRVGYGHIRAALAVTDYLTEAAAEAQLVDAAKEGSPLLKPYLKALDKGLGLAYRRFPKLYLKVAGRGAEEGMTTVNRAAQILDQGQFDRTMKQARVHVAAHPTPAAISAKPTLLLALDPYPPLYNVNKPNVITLTPDLETAQALKNQTDRLVVVTGPFVAKAIGEARERFDTRKEELQQGAGLEVTIATGGGLTHGSDIVALARAYAQAIENGQRIGQVNIVVGDSSQMKKDVEVVRSALPPNLQNQINIIYSEDQVALVREADEAMGRSDVIHAKTGELVYTVSGGKVFETFPTDPSLAPQEIHLKEYVRDNTVAVKHDALVNALEDGLKDARAEVAKILDQLQDGTLVDRMEAGLQVPANGAEYAASTALTLLAKLKR